MHGSNAFGFALYDHVVAGAVDSNVFLSPSSAALALALATEGAGGSTRAALARTLGSEALSPEEFTKRNAALVRSLASAEQVTLVVANAFWGDADVPFDKSFAARLAGDYRATVETVDLQAPDFPARANAWVSRQTAGKIPTLVDAPLGGDATLYLANAVYFKGKWTDAFEPRRTAPAPFLLPDCKSRPQPFMRREGTYAYFADSAFRIARLPYRGNRLAMYVILPAKRVEPITVRRPTETWFSGAVRRLTPTELAVALPRFVLRYAAPLNGPLSAMGAAPAFGPGADFTRAISAATPKSRRVYISEVAQQTYVEVNEEGTEAAAATSVALSDSGGAPPPLPFVVDHPFVVVIRDDKTGALLFLGQITNPASGGT
ncbi:MAG TPA: serpin family protein [Gemmatimonadaceae bacterium]|nr:serpin family protein [Gemmatimonadaceae bacterium]